MATVRVPDDAGIIRDENNEGPAGRRGREDDV